MKIISEHEDSEHSSLDSDEERILHGALMFSHRLVREVMTTLEDVIMFEENQFLMMRSESISMMKVTRVFRSIEKTPQTSSVFSTQRTF